MTEKKQGSYIKDRVRLRTRSVLVAGAVVLGWVNLGAPLELEGLKAVSPAALWSFAPSLLVLIVMVLDSLPGEQAKATLVFWRLKHPLPGCRAFEKEQLERDVRADERRLVQLAGGSFPRAAVDQNRLWYRLYRTVEADPRVVGVHTDYLTLRDASWFLVLLGGAALASALLFRGPGNVIFAGVCLVLYVLARQAAAERGMRFVSTVLAVVSSESKAAGGTQ
jgi:hypothetical protein